MEPEALIPGMDQMHPMQKEPQKSEVKIRSHCCKALQCVVNNPVPLEGSQTMENTCNMEA